ncbi:MAG: hypothetical protein H0W70_04690 [Actinobacteria bacterium]|nr:hypothetical protein [Actinomycetota bacterium]
MEGVGTNSSAARFPGERRNRRTKAALRTLVLAAFIVATVPALTPRASALGTASLTQLDVAHVEDFNTLATAGTSSITPPGWFFVETGTNANETYTAGSGTINTGDTYSFGAAGVPERAFGMLRAGTLVPTIGARLVNSTGSAINALDIAYTGEQWRLGTLARPDQLDFQYSLDAVSLATGTWTDVNGLDFAAPTDGPTVGALDGNANSTTRSATISGLSIQPDASFWLRWTDFDASGADDGLAVDDFQITPHAATTSSTTTTLPPVTTTSTSTTTTLPPVTTTSSTTTTLPPVTTTSSTTTTLPPTSSTSTSTTLPPPPTCDGRVATIIGTSGDDSIYGTPGPDVIVGLGGNDDVYGQGGDDVICGGTGLDNIYAGDGNDRAFGEAGADTLYGQAGNDFLSGGSENDYLYGGDGDDTLDGGPQSDQCYGMAGNDSATACESYYG